MIVKGCETFKRFFTKMWDFEIDFLQLHTSTVMPEGEKHGGGAVVLGGDNLPSRFE